MYTYVCVCVYIYIYIKTRCLGFQFLVLLYSGQFWKVSLVSEGTMFTVSAISAFHNTLIFINPSRLFINSQYVE